MVLTPGNWYAEPAELVWAVWYPSISFVLAKDPVQPETRAVAGADPRRNGGIIIGIEQQQQLSRCPWGEGLWVGRIEAAPVGCWRRGRGAGARRTHMDMQTPTVE